MLNQEGYFHVAALRAPLKELRTVLSTRKKRKRVVSVGSRGNTLSGGPKASQHPDNLIARKCKANEVVISSNSTEPANRRPAPGAGSAPMPAFASATDEQIALGSRQLGPPDVGVTYAAALAGPVAQCQPSGSFKPTPMDSDVS